jgi:hypothetical protein
MDSSLVELRNRIVGEVVMPTSQAYEGLRNIFNQEGRPAVIVRGHTNGDIVTALRFARERHLPLSVRSGGHDWNGTATNTDGLVLDLTPFSKVELLDLEKRLVRIGAGAHWGEVARALADYGLAISSGDTNQVGVGGLTLGGGIGWMVRKYGLTIDSLQAAELITADGRILRVSALEHPDLFWAIRGGGGNFGVVTSFDFSAQPCTMIVGGSAIYDVNEAETVLTNWTRAVRQAPEELDSTLVLFSGSGPHVPPRITMLLCYAGENEAEASAAIEPFLRLGAVQSQEIQKKPYYAMLENAVPLPPSRKIVGHSGFLKTLSKEAIAALAANYGKPGKPIAQIRALGGAMARVGEQETAFAHRTCEALVVMTAFAPKNATEQQAQDVRRSAWHPLESLANGAYVNFLSDTSEASVATAYPSSTYARLANIKAKYDPENVFNQNLNIKPARSTQGDARH